MDPVTEPRAVKIPRRSGRKTESGIEIPSRVSYKDKIATLYTVGYGPEGEIGFLRFDDGDITWTRTSDLRKMWTYS